MKLQVGTEFNVIQAEDNKKYYRVIRFRNGYFESVDEDGFVITTQSTIGKINDYYEGFKIEIIPTAEQGEVKDEKLGELSAEEIGRAVAYELMKDGKSVSKHTLEIIEEAVFNLLIEKEIILEEK